MVSGDNGITSGEWVLVPREPTQDMIATQGRSRPDLAKTDVIRRAAERLNEEVRRYAITIYREMVDAAPVPPGAEPVAWVSPAQFAEHGDLPDSDGGLYLPVRVTRAGLFTMPLYAAPPAPAQVGVKPLEWVKSNDGLLKRAESVLGTYRAWTYHEANGEWFWELATPGGFKIARGGGDTEASATKRAEQDQETRIRSALDLSPDAGKMVVTEEMVERASEAFRDAQAAWSAHPEAPLDCMPSPIRAALTAALKGSQL